MYNKLTKKQAIELYKNGLSSYKISIKLNIPSKSIWRWVNKIDAIRKNKIYSPFIKFRALELYKKGHTPKEIIKMLNLPCKYTVNLWATKAKIARRAGASCGEKSPFWKGGITELNHGLKATGEYKRWRLFVLKRDGFKCQGCEQIGGELHSHHILSWVKYPDKRFDVDNGITLCQKCHSDLHGKPVNQRKEA